jgi:S1-C subfamily serine protease
VPTVPTVVEGTGGEKPADAVVVTLAVPALELPTVEVVKILTPSVVQIVTEIAGMGFSNNPNPQSGVGTGVVLDIEGHILTNNHVVSGAQRITATLSDGRSFSATVVGTDQTTDLAIILIDADNLVPAMLGESSALQVGQDVIAIGHALGLPGGPTVSKGVVSALGRSIDTDQQNTIVDLIQTDTSINPGNSGGPLVDNGAKVIGINTAIIQGSQGIGFAINIDDAKEVARQLMDQGFVRRGFLGITPINLTPGIAMQLRLPVSEGVLVIRVYANTAASDAGLLPEDIIVELDGQPVRNTGELAKFLISHQPGYTVAIVIVRNGNALSLELTLGDRPN